MSFFNGYISQSRSQILHAPGEMGEDVVRSRHALSGKVPSVLPHADVVERGSVLEEGTKTIEHKMVCRESPAKIVSLDHMPNRWRTAPAC
jgi:hypothetical protein